MILANNIIQQGNKTLNLIAKTVTFPLSEENRKIADDILEYLKNSQNEEIAEKYNLRAGVGLAAPQINKSVRIFGIYKPAFNEMDTPLEKIFINPKIVSHSEKMCYLQSGEGCLSVDDEISGFVPRFKKITISAYDIDGKQFTMRLSNYNSIVFQHEFDHLNGLLFTEKTIEDPSGLEAI